MSQISSTFLCLAAFLAIGASVSAFLLQDPEERGPGLPRHPPRGPFLPRSTPSEKFAACCRQIQPPLRDDSIKDCCKFVPENPTTVEAKDIGQRGHYNPYIQCYSNKKDNRQCCKENGVVGEYEICQDLCDGTHHHEAPPKSPMYICETSWIKGNISMCNEKAYGDFE